MEFRVRNKVQPYRDRNGCAIEGDKAHCVENCWMPGFLISSIN